jgi:hypothetical protein
VCCSCLVAFALTTTGQQLIGLDKGEVKSRIRQAYPGFVPDNSSVNRHFNYLKYIDPVNEQTLLIFMSTSDIVESEKLMSDYMNLRSTRESLDKKFARVGENQWMHKSTGKEFQILLKEEEWYFSVTIRKKE